jgi:hypothetical protein
MQNWGKKCGSYIRKQKGILAKQKNRREKITDTAPSTGKFSINLHQIQNGEH